MNRRKFLKHFAALSGAPLFGWAPQGEPLSKRDKPNIIILLFDTLSAPHLSLYGYPRNTTPNLARFARRAVVYHNHYTTGNFTSPGTASLLTGTYPWTNRAFHLGARMARSLEQQTIFRVGDNEYTTVAYPHNVFAHLLLNQIAQQIDVYLKPETFSLFDDMFHSRLLSRDTDVSMRAMEDLLFNDFGSPGALFLPIIENIKTLLSVVSMNEKYEERYPRGLPFLAHYQVHFLVEDIVDGVARVLRETRQPFVAYFHLFPPHEPYCPRAEFAEIFQDNWKPVVKPEHVFSQGMPQQLLDTHRVCYDQYIAHTDAEFGRLYDMLEETGLLRNSYVAITSDHGQLFERGVHGHSTQFLYEPLIHVPLLVAQPGQRRRRDVRTPTSSVDVLPTLLHLMEQPPPDCSEGKLLPELGGVCDSERPVFAVEARGNAANAPLTEATTAIIKGSYKLIHYFGYSGYEDECELYNLRDDPEEMNDLSQTKKTLAAELRHQLTQKIAEVNQRYLP